MAFLTSYAFVIVKDCIVTNPLCVIGFDIIQEYFPSPEIKV
jgi:hypothetical protein